jgi:hypothetical protein
MSDAICPFCGYDMVNNQFEAFYGFQMGFTIRCPSCGETINKYHSPSQVTLEQYRKEHSIYYRVKNWLKKRVNIILVTILGILATYALFLILVIQ